MQAKTTAMSPWSEFEPLMQRVLDATSLTIPEVMAHIGYNSSGSYYKWEQTGEVPTRARYAIAGYLWELGGSAPPLFTKAELVTLFGLLNGWQIPSAVRNALSDKIANQVVTNGTR